MTDVKREWRLLAPRGRHAPAASTVSRGRVVPIAPCRSPARALTPAEMSAPDDAAAPREHEEDVALLRAIARGDRRAFEALYYRHAERLGRYAMRLLGRRDLVGEVIDDVMLVVWQNAARFDPEVSRPSTWLFGITHHKALKRAQSSSRLDAAARSGPDVPAAEEQDTSAASDPERAAMGHQLGMALADALAQLSADHRAVVELAFGENRSYQEIAAITGSPVNTVKTRMFHARKRLARLLGWGGEAQGSKVR